MQERTESLGHFEMLWDCDHCDSKGLLAKSQRYCATCGAPQNPDKRYFPKAGEERRVDGHRFVGADRTCPSCSTPQSAAATNCTYCGAPLAGAKDVRGVATSPPLPKRPRRQWRVLAIVAGIGVVVLAIWFFGFRTRVAQLTITGHRWERAIAVEEYSATQETGWRDQLPADARDVSCVQKQRSTRSVPTGEERCTTERKDNKDGTYEQIRRCTPVYRSEPVDDDWCRYMLLRWNQVDAIKASGTGMAPAWPATNLPPTSAATTLGARRQGKRTETLILDLGGQSCTVSASVWRAYQDGQAAAVDVRARSGAVVCSSL